MAMRVRHYLLLHVSLVACALSARTWTDVNNNKLEAEYVSATADTVKVKRVADSVVFDIPLTSLSEGDQEFIAVQLSENASGVGAKNNTSSDAVPKLDWPKRIEDWRNTKLESVPHESGEMVCQYTSPHYEFYSIVNLPNGEIRPFASFLEGIYETIQAMPLALNPAPSEGERWRVYIYDDRDDYKALFVAADARPGSGNYVYAHRGALHVALPVITGKDLRPEIEIVDLVTSKSKMSMKGTLFMYPFDISYREMNQTFMEDVTQLLLSQREHPLPPWVIYGVAEMLYLFYDAGRSRFELKTDDIEPYLISIFVRDAPRQTKNGYTASPNHKFMKAIVVAPFDEIITATTFDEFNRNHLGYEYDIILEDYQLMTDKVKNVGTLFYFLCHGEESASGQRLYRYLRAIDNGTPPNEAASILIDERGYWGLFVDMAEYIESNSRYEVLDFETGKKANGQMSKYYQ